MKSRSECLGGGALRRSGCCQAYRGETRIREAFGTAWRLRGGVRAWRSGCTEGAGAISARLYGWFQAESEGPKADFRNVERIEPAAESFASRPESNVAILSRIHFDDLSGSQIQEIHRICQELAGDILPVLENQVSGRPRPKDVLESPNGRWMTSQSWRSRR